MSPSFLPSFLQAVAAGRGSVAPQPGQDSNTFGLSRIPAAHVNLPTEMWRMPIQQRCFITQRKAGVRSKVRWCEGRES